MLRVSMHRSRPPLMRRIILLISFFYMVNAGPSYYITAPQYIAPGVDTAVAVHLFGTNYSEINVSAQILENGMKVLTEASGIFSIDSIGILTIPALPKNASTSIYYNLDVTGTAQNTTVFYNSVSLRLAPVHVFIETDKVNYRPGQAVKIRVISTYHDLSPYKGDVELVVMDPENNIVQKWPKLITDQGVISTEFLLSVNPMIIKWQIQATAGEAKSSAYFNVTNYDLPTFDVTINVSTAYYIYTKKQNLTGTVTAKDLFGKPISGNLTVSLRHFYYYYTDSDTYYEYYYDYYYYYYNQYKVNKTYEIVSGSADFSFTNEETLLNGYWYGRAILVTALVTDEMTGTAKNASVKIKLTDSEYKFMMISEPQVPEPDFNYTTKMQILRIDDTPLSKEERHNITVRIEQYVYNNRALESKLESDDNILQTTASNSVFSSTVSTTSISQAPVLNLSASPIPFYTTMISPSFGSHMPVSNASAPLSSVFTTLFSPVQLSTTSGPASPISSASTSTKSVSTTSNSTTPFSTTTSYSSSYHIIEKQYDIPESGIISIEFPVVKSYGWISLQVQYQNIYRYWYLVNPFYYYYYDYYNYNKCNAANMRISNSTKKVGEAFQVQVSTFRKVQELYYVVLAKDGVVAAGTKRNTSFTLTPEQSWAPSVTLIVYLLNSNCSHNISKTSRKIYIKNSFKNTVILLWSKSKLEPGENGSLTINVGGTQSLVGLRVVEKTVKENENDLTASRIQSELIQYIQESRVSDATSIYENNYYYYYYPFDVFRPDYGEDLPLKQPESVTDVYPETWLWLETNISSGSSKKLDVTTPLTNSTWVASAFVISEKLGLGVTEELVEVAVSRPFFISVNLPYSVTRGEQFVLEVTLYNYNTQKLEATVVLEASDSFEVITNNDAGTVAGQIKVTVPMEDKETVLFPIRPKKLGKIPVKVKATSSSEESDAVSKTIFVKAEGVKQFYSEAAVFQVSDGGTVSKTFSFPFPSDVVHDSEEAFVTVVGDILGPSIDGLESLIQMPYGCGEQNMINFAPNIYVIQYLTATKQIKDEIRTRAINYMENGYQRELTYKRNDGSFSAFGNSDSSGSTWLSAFVLRCFLQARPFIFISQDVLDKTVQWLVEYQDLNTGIFSEPGRVIHSELQGGLNGPITLTAYILTSLLEDENYKNLYASRVDKAIKYLESKFAEGISSNYTLSVVAYALSLANSTNASLALTQLNSKADKRGGVMYWASPSESASYWQPKSSDIEAAAYALLSHQIQNRIFEGIPIMKWLSQQRSHLGGYSSTQDTIMALQALAKFMIANPTADTSLTLTVNGSSVPKIFQINSENLLVLQSQQITVSQPLSITVSAAGRGIAIFQLNINYNQKASSRRKRNALISETFSLDVTVNDNKTDIQRLSVDICTSYLGSGNESGMALLDVGFLSGFGLDPKGIPTEGSLKMVETTGDKVYLYLDSVNKSQVCVSVPMVRGANVAGSQDSVITIVEYYNTRNSATRTYNSETMKAISSCDFCGLNCTLCQSNVKVDPQTTVGDKPQTTTQRNTKPTSSSVQQALNVFTVFLVCVHYILWY